MIKETSWVWKKNIQKVTFKYDTRNKVDDALMKRIYKLIESQPSCNNCNNYYLGGTFCGWKDHNCKIYGCLDSLGNQRDASTCEHYDRKIEYCSECGRELNEGD